MHGLQISARVLRRAFWFTLFALAFMPSASRAQTGLQIQLVSEQSAIVPGKPFTVGLHLQHQRGWHTYWRFPGIVGIPTQLKWNLPEGWKAGELVYPEPERTFMFKIKAQGFDRDVILRTEIKPPWHLKVGDQITLSAKATWMCCGDTCHPGSMDLSLDLPVAETAGLNDKWHKLLEEERARAEKTSDAWAATASEVGETITLSLKPATIEARLTHDQREADRIIVFTEDGWFDSNKPQTIQRHDDGSLTVTLLRADSYLGGKPPKTLRAILRNEDGWLRRGQLRCLQIEPKIKR
jgi:thiol:disulfide interchange protein DsbD